MTEKNKNVPCRLFVILARSAPVGVIFRRGPSKWVQLIKWNTADDSFEPGQWFHGRIYERRCDLSPLGSRLIYFASKFNRRTLADPEYTYAWTAISKPPNFTALALWPKGDCWHGGGLFETNRTVWLNHRPDAAKPHPKHNPKGFKIIPNPEAYGEDGPVYGRKIIRDGWIRARQGSFVGSPKGLKTDRSEIWEKPNKNNSAVLTMELAGVNFKKLGSPYVERFALVKDNNTVPLGEADWADWDQRDRLVLARDGKLFAANIKDGQLSLSELADFNASSPETTRPAKPL
jgi:hypothetical protein